MQQESPLASDIVTNPRHLAASESTPDSETCAIFTLVQPLGPIAVACVV
jgi:hypothetical protein